MAANKKTVKTASKTAAPKTARPVAAKAKAAPKSAAPKAPSKAPPKPAKAGSSSAPPPKAAPAKAAQATAAVEGPGARKSKPPPPRLTVRSPAGADELKAKIGALANATQQIRNLKRSMQRSFYEIGQILGDIRDRRLFEAKGYGSFEAFVEREIDLGKQLSLRLARVAQVFVKEAATAAGLERVTAAIAALDGEVDHAPSGPSAPTATGGVRSPIPFHKQ